MINNSKSLTDKILYFCRYEYKYFLNKSNVTGVGLSYKIKNGFNTYKKCIRVFTTQKLPRNRLLSQDLIPPYYKGIETDVVRDGLNIGLSLRNKVRPVTAGYNILPIKGLYSGTFGCLVKDDTSFYVLSNNHVLAGCNNIPIETPIIQPSFSYGGKYPEDAIANLSKFIPLQFSTKTSRPENFVDCAIAKIVNKSLFSPTVTFLGGIKGITKPALNLPVQKVGSSSELTSGKITTLGVTRLVEFTNGKRCIFKNQIITTKLAEDGDSGSVLFDTNMHAIGLTLSSSDTSTTFNPINTVLSSLNVSIVTS